VLEKLSLTTNNGVTTKQTALINLRSGNLVSNIDPAKRAINNYAVRTPKGVIAAQGTSYSVSVTANGFSVAATADSVTFTTSTGATYIIQAGMISITPAGGTPQPPVALAQALASNPQVAGIMSDAVATISTVVQNNLGGLSAESTTTLASQVLGVASAAVPSQAATYTTQVVSAVTSSTSVTGATSSTSSAAVAAVVAAAVTGAPQQAAQVASAGATASPTQAGVVAAAASGAAPASSNSVMQSVASATGQSVAAVQQSSNSAASQVAQAVQSTQASVQAVVTPNAPSMTPPSPVNSPVVSPSSCAGSWSEIFQPR
jgi:hypothetical protein